MNYSIEDAMEDLDFDDYADYANEDFVIKSEGEEGYDEENSILVANLDWAPMPESISWQDPNFSKDLVSRLKGISEESFAKEVQNWQDAISLLPVYDELEI